MEKNIVSTKEGLLTLIESELLEKRENTGLFSKRLLEATMYSLLGGGKRIRPLFALSLVNDFGGDTEAAVKLVIPLEIIHCSSLIHDDLPSLDNDDYRRGKESCHKKFGEGVAVLAGDSLIGLAFHIIATSSVHTELRTALISELSFAFLQLCNGQELDIADVESRGLTDEIHQQKTGALFGASFVFGLYISEIRNSSLLNHARECGKKFGLLFQILDDYLDLYGDPKKRGRPAGSDLKNNKLTALSQSTKESMLVKLQNLRKDVLTHFQILEGHFRIENSLTKEILYDALSIERFF